MLVMGDNMGDVRDDEVTSSEVAEVGGHVGHMGKHT